MHVIFSLQVLLDTQNQNDTTSHPRKSLIVYHCRLPGSSSERNMRPEPPSEWRGAEGRVGHVWEKLQWNICQETVTKRGWKGGEAELHTIQRQFVSTAVEVRPKTGEQLEPHHD